MKTGITESEELLGKKIKRTDYIDNHFFLFFTDDTFCVFKGCGIRDVELMDKDFKIKPTENNYKELHGLGFITDLVKNKFEVKLLQHKRAIEEILDILKVKQTIVKYQNIVNMKQEKLNTKK